jgi:hypothetical protein
VKDLGDEFNSLRRREDCTTAQFYDILMKRFGGVHRETASRIAWAAVMLPTSEKTTTHIFRAFQVRFMDAYRQVPETNAAEGARVLKRKIPNFMQIWISEEEEKQRVRAARQCLVNFGVRCPDKHVIANLTSKAGEAPLRWARVETPEGDLTNQLWVIFADERAANRMLAWHGRQMPRGPMSVLPQPYKLSMEQIFETCMTRLRVRDIADGMKGDRSDPFPGANHTARAVRKAAAQEQIDADSSVSQHSGTQEKRMRTVAPDRTTAAKTITPH